MIALALTVAVALVTCALVMALLPAGLIGTLLTVILASTLLAQRSLHEHVEAVADALENGGLGPGRVTVAEIVGRDPAALDEAGVARAAIESLAENFSDGVVAPAFFIALFGLPGGAVYKAANTADSMIGHLTARHAAFGFAAARFDDLVNLPASRLAALWLGLAAFVVPGASPSKRRARGAARREAPSLAQRRLARGRDGGRARAEARRTARLWRRHGRGRLYGRRARRHAGVRDIRRALRLYRAACALQMIVYALLAAALIARA